MELIVVLPALLCMAVLLFKSIRHAWIYVYLPTILLLPEYYPLRLSHIPPLSFGDMAILPLGAALVLTQLKRWRWDWMDLWVLLYVLGAAVSEGLSEQVATGSWMQLFSAHSAASPTLTYSINNGVYALFARMTSILLPYMASKLLIEHGEVGGVPTRRAMVRVMVVVLAAVALYSTVDFVTGKSSWIHGFAPFFPNETVDWTEQVRWGFGRIAGPFGHAILAGMVFLTALLYCLWLLRADHAWASRRIIAGVNLTPRPLLFAALLAGLVMTQSRGPWVGMVLSAIFAGLVRVLSVRKAAGVFLLLVAIVGSLVMIAGERYTRGSRETASSAEQESAIYRRDLLRNYSPVIAQRPSFGWGFSDYPSANGQKSIDNEFLLTVVTQGFVGLLLFLAIITGTGLRLLRLAAQPMTHEDSTLVYAHIAVLLGLVVSLATVYMGEQMVMIFFIMTGWIHGMKPNTPLADTTNAELRFRRVLS